jgi:hypothetical protein
MASLLAAQPPQITRLDHPTLAGLNDQRLCCHQRHRAKPFLTKRLLDALHSGGELRQIRMESTQKSGARHQHRQQRLPGQPLGCAGGQEIRRHHHLRHAYHLPPKPLSGTNVRRRTATCCPQHSCSMGAALTGLAGHARGQRPEARADTPDRLAHGWSPPVSARPQSRVHP